MKVRKAITLSGKPGCNKIARGYHIVNTDAFSQAAAHRTEPGIIATAEFRIKQMEKSDLPYIRISVQRRIPIWGNFV